MSTTARSFIAFVLCGAAIVAIMGSRASSERGAQSDLADNVDALVAQGLYVRAEEIARADIDRTRRAIGANSIEAAAALDSLVRVLLLNGKGSLPTSVALAEQALNIRESRPQGSRADVAGSLINLGSALGEAGAHKRAIPLLERAVAVRQQDAPAGLPLARALDALGAELIRASRYADALGPLERSRTIIDGHA